MASRNRMMKMAQFEPSVSRWGILDGSCSIAGDGVDVDILKWFAKRLFGGN